jgi:single-stranded-DNA-specific exonuclease
MVWDKKEVHPEVVREISTKYGCGLVAASILARRGITNPGDILYYLEDDKRYLHNPFLLPNMEDAVERVLGAIEEGEKVLVFGDRDVDGITSTSLLAANLKKMGLDVEWRIPVGDEPYGLSLEAVEEFEKTGGTLIITVDCGISNFPEIERAVELGIDVIVLDHHNPQDELPRAHAIVDPKLPESMYPFKEICAAVVGWKFIQALNFARSSELFNQNLALLNVSPKNDNTFLIEAVRVRNMVITKRLDETIVAGAVSVSDTRIPSFLQGQSILVWDEKSQKAMLKAVFGRGVEFQLYDIASDIAKLFPQTAGKSLLRLREASSFAKYSPSTLDEIDVFSNLYISYVQKKEAFNSPLDNDNLQLACLGTIADIMPLENENRIIVRQGLANLKQKPRAGIANLAASGMQGKTYNSKSVSWSLTPVINSAGRMGAPDKAVELFLTEDRDIRDRLAGEIFKMNEERKRLGEEAVQKALPEAEGLFEKFSGNFAVTYSADIPRGVTGIIANRLSSHFKTPALAVSFVDGLAVGSLRSSRGYSLTGLLESCSEYFVRWGGHDFAAGFSIESRNWPAFLERLVQISSIIELEELPDDESISIDAELPPAYLNPDIIKVVDRFEPVGQGSKPLIFLCKNLAVADIKFLGKVEQKHIRLTLSTGTTSWPAVYWNAASKVNNDFALGVSVDAVFHIEKDNFGGDEKLQLNIIDLKKH